MCILRSVATWSSALVLLGCGSGASSPHDPGAEPAQPGEGATVSSTPSEAQGASTDLPPDMHVVVFFDHEGQRHHLDVRVRSDASETSIAGVRADETRAHPVPQRFTLDAAERTTFARLIGAFSAMPRCEPLASFPNEPQWQVESERYSDRGPALWFRDNGPTMLNSTDPCLAFVRLAHFVYTAWDAHVGI